MIEGVKQAPLIAEHTHKNKKNFIDNLVKFISTLEKDNRIYNIEELKIKNPIQKNSPGVEVSMKVFEINIGN